MGPVLIPATLLRWRHNPMARRWVNPPRRPGRLSMTAELRELVSPYHRRGTVVLIREAVGF